MLGLTSKWRFKSCWMSKDSPLWLLIWFLYKCL